MSNALRSLKYIADEKLEEEVGEKEEDHEEKKQARRLFPLPHLEK